MTDKQIIIDDIDVSGCAYFWNKECRCIQDCIDYSGNNSTIKELFHKDTGIFADCENSPSCYYKQLKYLEKAFDYRENTYTTNLNNLAKESKFLREKLQAKEQECEQQKAELELFKISNQTTIDQLKIENDKLKKQLESTKGLVTVGNKQLMEALFELQKQQHENCHFDKIKELTKEM